MIVSAATHTRVIETTAKKLGVPLPAKFVDAMATARKLVRDTEALEGATGNLNDRVIHVLLEGQDPGADPEVQNLIAQRVLGDSGIRHAGVEYASDLISAAIAENSEATLTAWAKAVAPDCAKLTEAAHRLDDRVLIEAQAHELKRRGLIDIWSEALGAADRINNAHTGFKAIITAIHVQHQREHRALALIPDADIDTIAEANTQNDLDAWTIARLGHPLRLATVSEFVAAIGNYTAAKQARQRDLERRNKSGAGVSA